MVPSSHLNQETLKQLHLEVLPPATRGAFLNCAENSLFASGGWYLAGGTALALQVGHRQSVDLDFFTVEKSFDEKATTEKLSEIGDWQTTSVSKGTIYGELSKAKLSLISYPFFAPTKPFLEVGHVSIVSPANVAAMKIVAVSQRGRKRDFIDLYWISKTLQPLARSVEQAQAQYSVQQNPNHLLKSLVYFEDAEEDPMPKLFFDFDWDEVKNYFRREVPPLAKKLIGLD